MTAAGRFDRMYQVSPQSDPFLSFYLGKLQPYYSLNVHPRPLGIHRRPGRCSDRADLGQGGEGNRMPTRAIPKSQLARTCGVRAVGRSRDAVHGRYSIITFKRTSSDISLQMKALKLSCCAGVLDSCASKPVRRPTRRNGSAVPTQADCLNQDDC